MLEFAKHYTRWLHTRWPAGVVEKLPQVDENGRSNVPGLYIVGDLTGIPLLKFSADAGARAVQHIAADQRLQRHRQNDEEVRDIAIIGAGISGMSAALEARRQGLSIAAAGFRTFRKNAGDRVTPLAPLLLPFLSARSSWQT